MSTENSAPQHTASAASKAEQVAWLGKLTKTSAGPAGRARVRACLATGDWELVWHALKAAKKIGSAAECADLIVDKIAGIQVVPSAKRTYYMKALEAAGTAAGGAMKPHMDFLLSLALRPEPNFDDDHRVDYNILDGMQEANSCARSLLSGLSAHVTEALAQSAFAKLDDPSAEVRVAALATTTALKRFVTGAIIQKIIHCSRDADDKVRSEAAFSLENCMGFEWRFHKSSSNSLTKEDHCLLYTSPSPRDS